MKTGLFVTGTDTGIGKTITSAMLCYSLARAGRNPGYFKPVQTGTDDDTRTVIEFSGLSADRTCPPAYFFPEPISPNRAAERHGAEIRLETIVDHWRNAGDGVWIVEGAGGIRVPLNARQDTRDLIAALELPLLIVSSTRLGTINHTLLTIEAARIARIPVAGLVLTGEADPGLAELFRERTGIATTIEVSQLTNVNPQTLAETAARVFSSEILATLL